MAKFRNITDEVLWVDVNGALVPVAPDTVVDIPAGKYVQTGETGETPLFAVVSDTPKKGSK